MNRLQQALAEATPDEVAIVLQPFAIYGVKTFHDLGREFARREAFMQSRLTMESEQKKNAELAEARVSAHKALRDAGLSEKQVPDANCPLVEAYIHMPEGKRAEFLKELLPEPKGGERRATPAPAKPEGEQKAELAEAEVAELHGIFAHPTKVAAK